MPEKVFCCQCGAAILADSEFCHICGAKQPVETAPPKASACPECGAKITDDSDFCFKCGAKIESSASEENEKPALNNHSAENTENAIIKNAAPQAATPAASAAEMKENKYRHAVELTEQGYLGALQGAARLFSELGDYKESKDKLTLCKKKIAEREMKSDKAAIQADSSKSAKKAGKKLIIPIISVCIAAVGVIAAVVIANPFENKDNIASSIPSSTPVQSSSTSATANSSSSSSTSTSASSEDSPSSEPEKTEDRYTTNETIIWSSASFSATALNRIPRRTRISVYPDQTTHNEGYDWIKASYNNQTGWVNSTDLSITDPGEITVSAEDFIGYYGMWDFNGFHYIEITTVKYGLYLDVSYDSLSCYGNISPGDIVGDTIYFSVNGVQHTLKLKLPEYEYGNKFLYLDGSVEFARDFM